MAAGIARPARTRRAVLDEIAVVLHGDVRARLYRANVAVVRAPQVVATGIIDCEVAVALHDSLESMGIDPWRAPQYANAFPVEAEVPVALHGDEEPAVRRPQGALAGVLDQRLPRVDGVPTGGRRRPDGNRHARVVATHGPAVELGGDDGNEGGTADVRSQARGVHHRLRVGHGRTLDPYPEARELSGQPGQREVRTREPDRKSTRLNSSHLVISYAVFCLKKKKKTNIT